MNVKARKIHVHTPEMASELQSKKLSFLENVYATYMYIHVQSVVGFNPTRGSSFFFGKVTALGVLCCFAMLFV